MIQNKIIDWDYRKGRCKIEGTEEFVSYWTDIFFKVSNKKVLVKKFKHLFASEEEEHQYYIKRIKELISEGFVCYKYNEIYIANHKKLSRNNISMFYEVEKLAKWLDEIIVKEKEEFINLYKMLFSKN